MTFLRLKPKASQKLQTSDGTGFKMVLQALQAPGFINP
jgi:hypothetical protein